VMLGASSLLLIGVIVQRKLTEGKMLPLGPLVGLLVSIWSWMIFSGWDPLLRYAIPALHSLQYLFFVYLIRKNEAKAHEGPPSFGRPVVVRLVTIALASLGLGWLLFHGLPEFLDLAFTPRIPPGDVDELGRLLLAHVLGRWPNLPLRFVIDDTLAPHKGPQIFGLGCHVDAVRSTRKTKVFTFGHVWVTLALVVDVPFSSRP